MSRTPALFSTTQRLFLVASFCVSLFAFGLGSASTARAQKGGIQLFTLDNSYVPGKAVTIYAYFFRVPTPQGFFSSLARHIGHSNDLQLQKRTRIMAFREELRDSMGFPQGELSHELYRLRLMPRHAGSVLRYGPIQYQGSSSNVLGFRQNAASQSSQVQLQLDLPTQTLREGQQFEATLLIRCPLSLCNYSGVNTQSVINYMQNKTQVSAADGLWLQQHQVQPQMTSGTHHVEFRLNYRFTPLKSGKLKTPKIFVPIPVAELLNQGEIERRMRKWLIDKYAFTNAKAVRYVNIRRKQHSFLSIQKMEVASKEIKVLPAKGCRGAWTLSSQLVTPDNGQTAYWQVSLKGNGFLLQADRFLRAKLKQAISPSLMEKLRLTHVFWRLPEQSISGRGGVHFLFAFQGARVALPALQMQFVDNNDKTYARKTSALTPKDRLSPLTIPLNTNVKARKVYIYQDQAPTAKQAQQADVWTFQLERGFPLYHVLSRRWNIHSDLVLQSEQKMKNFVQRSSRQGQFGAFFSMSTRSVPIQVNTSQIQVSLKTGPFAKFPTVEWGTQWVKPHIESGNGLSIKATTHQSKYYAGESVEYRLVVRCPTADCPEKSAGFYKQLFQSNFKLPKFERFSGWRQLDRFTRADDNSGWTTFTYRARFKAPQSKQLELKGATLRLSEGLLTRLHNKDNICFFRSGRSDGLLLSSIARDHYGQRSQEDCALGTQEISTSALQVPIEGLPTNANDVKLIGTFRLKARLEQLTYPNKHATVVDKPFFLIVDIAGSGDLETARELLKDQLARITRDLRKSNVTADTQVVNDSDLQKRGIARIQLQLIAEQEGKIKIPSLSLRHYHRTEGLLTAQTLPLDVKIEPRTGPAVANVRPPTPTSNTDTKKRFQQSTDLRPNMIIGTQRLDNQWFTLSDWTYLAWLLLSPFGFLLFLGWHQTDKRNTADPQKLQQQRSLKQFKQGLARVGDAAGWERDALNVLQQYLIERMSLNKKQLTASDTTALFKQKLGPEAPAAATALTEAMLAMESALYGGSPIEARRDFLRALEQHVGTLHRALPQRNTEV